MLKFRARYTSIGMAVVFLVVLFVFYERLTDTSIHQSLAAEQIELFETFATNGGSHSTMTYEERISQIQGYYPSGTKQLKGTPLDTAVESARRMALRSIELERRLYERDRLSQDLAQDD